MKLLLDEQIPRKLAGFFPEAWTIKTVQDMAWDGISNGELLALAHDSDFDAVVTADKNLQYQQNLLNLPLPVMVLAATSTRIQDLSPLVSDAIQLLGTDLQPDIHRVEA